MLGELYWVMNHIKQPLKQIIKKTPIYYYMCYWSKMQKQKKEILQWKKNGKQIPPPHIIKQKTLKVYAKRFKAKILVETGTFYGDMIEAMKHNFDYIFSIELSKELYEKAKERFQDEDHIELINGDSGSELGNILERINQPSLFWLDGHYSSGITAKGSKDTPVYEELNHILNAQDLGHVIIIDDARCFGSDPAYPSIEELTEFIKSKKPDTSILVQDDIIRITPKLIP